MPFPHWLASIFGRSSPSLPIYYFLHIPKCAGTAVISALSQQSRRNWVIVSDSPDSKAQANRDLLAAIAANRASTQRLQVVMGHDVHLSMHQLPPVQQRLPFYFTFLRDPVQRYVSHYRYLVQCAADPDHPLQRFANQQIRPNNKQLSLDQYVEAKQMPNLMTQYLGAANDRDPNSKRWQRDEQQLWKLAEDAISQLDFIGFQESIDDDLSALCQRLKLKPRVARTNVTSGTRPEINRDLRTRIAELNQLDIQIHEWAITQRRLR